MHLYNLELLLRHQLHSGYVIGCPDNRGYIDCTVDAGSRSYGNADVSYVLLRVGVK